MVNDAALVKIVQSEDLPRGKTHKKATVMSENRKTYHFRTNDHDVVKREITIILGEHASGAHLRQDVQIPRRRPPRPHRATRVRKEEERRPDRLVRDHGEDPQLVDDASACRRG